MRGVCSRPTRRTSEIHLALGIASARTHAGRRVPGCAIMTLQQTSLVSPGIHIAKIWFDDHIVELRITVCDGRSSFTNQVYAGHHDFTAAVGALHEFKGQAQGGLHDMRFGAFGPEFANGAFLARFHFARPGRLFITCEQESDHHEFGVKNVASSATLHVTSEPALLDRFVAELRTVASGVRDDATLGAL